jgi:multiple sugar transport system permease protein/N-acetylglucosamine transport system permease protein
MFQTFSQPYNALKPALRNSLLYFPFNNFVLLPISLVCAYLLYKKVAGYRAFRVIFFFPSIISVVVLTLVFGFMFSSTFGPVNSILKAIGLGKIIPSDGWLGSKSTAQPMIFLYCLWAGIGYNVVLFSGAMQRVPAEILESARIDGVGMVREFAQIIVPIIFPTISTLFIQGCTVVFTLFMQPMLLTGGGPNNETMTIAYYVVNMVKSGAPRNLIDAATVGIFFSVIAIPVIFGIKALLERITPQVEY